MDDLSYNSSDCMTLCDDDEDLSLVDSLYYRNKIYQEAEKSFHRLTTPTESDTSNTTMASTPSLTATSLADPSTVPPTLSSTVSQSQADSSAIELLQTWSSQANPKSVIVCRLNPFD